MQSALPKKSNVTVTKPRITQHQQHRANVNAPSVEKYCEVTILLPFLNHVISETDAQFSQHVKKASLIQGLLPKSLTPQSSMTFQEAVDFYSADLPNPDVIDEEFARWKNKWVSVHDDERPSSLEDILKACGSASFSNLTALLKLFTVLPVSSVSCERSAFALRRLHT